MATTFHTARVCRFCEEFVIRSSVFDFFGLHKCAVYSILVFYRFKPIRYSCYEDVFKAVIQSGQIKETG